MHWFQEFFADCSAQSVEKFYKTRAQKISWNQLFSNFSSKNGNFGNLLLRNFGRKFVKATFLQKKLLCK